MCECSTNLIGGANNMSLEKSKLQGGERVHNGKVIKCLSDDDLKLLLKKLWVSAYNLKVRLVQSEISEAVFIANRNPVFETYTDVLNELFSRDSEYIRLAYSGELDHMHEDGVAENIMGFLDTRDEIYNGVKLASMSVVELELAYEDLEMQIKNLNSIIAVADKFHIGYLDSLKTLEYLCSDICAEICSCAGYDI